MSWVAISDHEEHSFSAHGFQNPTATRSLMDTSHGALVPRGSVVIETRLPTSSRPKQLIHYTRADVQNTHLSLQVLPSGGLSLVLDQDGKILHRTINYSDAGRADVVRITYSWDIRQNWAQLALEPTDQNKIVLDTITPARPLHVADVFGLTHPSEHRYISPDVLYLAISTNVEPVGPMPTLLPDTPIATPTGYRRVSDLQRGDLVLSGNGMTVPILQTVSRSVPAKGSFQPVELRAPYFGLKQSVRTSSLQRLVVTGAEVEYLFGHETVLVPACHLSGGTSVKPVSIGPVVTYNQVLLPGRESLIAAGAELDSLYIGRLHRRRKELHSSILSGHDRATLPDHGLSDLPVLKAFDAVVLAEQRSA